MTVISKRTIEGYIVRRKAVSKTRIARAKKGKVNSKENDRKKVERKLE